jgi:myo-inositol 2-dehydrogenase / D-chiro-inositol 1-dehydrogenase
MERRIFLKSAAAVSSMMILKPGVVFGSKANSAIQLGIIGCGDRGTAVISSMSKHTDINIMAMADLFPDQLQKGKVTLDALNAEKGFPAIEKANMYQGSKAYLQLLQNKNVEAVLISSPAYTHPEFMEAAVAAGKHVYCEKPVAPDVDGCKRMQRVGETIKGKVSAVIGFQIRHASPYVEMVKRIQSGAIGDVVNAQLYYLSSAIKLKPYKNIPHDQARIRNHFHFRALSGGILPDQGIHMLDVCNWALQSHPVSAIGSGSKNKGAEFGDAWNNYQVAYQYPQGINVSFHSTQIGNQFGDVCARFIGTKGIAEAHYSGGVFIKGENAWDSGVLRDEAKVTPEQQAAGIFLSSLHDADANKEKAFIDSIRSGKYLNEIQSGSESTLTAILGRQAAETGKRISWEEMRSANEKIDHGLNLAQFDKG